jgi:hypothetical protein
MKMNHLAFIMLISGISGNSLQGIEFTSRASTGVIISVEQGFDFSGGFTTCLRAMFTFIDWTSLFDSPESVEFELDHYWRETGIVRVSDISYHFQWPVQQVTLEPYHWYTFCIVYDVSINLISLSLNGKMIISVTGRQNPRDLKVPISSIMLGGNTSKPFIGKITDFNVWNVPLSESLIRDFSACKIAKDIKIPFRWSMVNLNLTGTDINGFEVSLEELCSDSPDNKAMLFNTPMSFNDANTVRRLLD